jgi:tuftelin-interacting protein 11
MSDYEHLVWTLVVPAFRSAIMASWRCREPQSLLDLMEAWHTLLPGWILANIRTQVHGGAHPANARIILWAHGALGCVAAQLVLPRVRQEVDAWDPRTDPVPIHKWLLPLAGWMPEHVPEVWQAVVALREGMGVG